MNIKEVTIGSNRYHIAQAPAKAQKTLLSLCGAMCAVNATTADIIEIDVKFLKGVLIGIGEERLDQITSIVFSKTYKAGEDRPVDIGDFQGKMGEYLELVANGIKANLQDFFTWLDEDRAAARPTTMSGKQTQA